MAIEMTRRQVLGSLLGAGVGLCVPAWADSLQGATRPNILFIMADDHAAHAISAYSSRIINTPNIDRIARDGVRFANCFCTNAICGPSRAAILTGKYSHMNGFATNQDKFDGGQTTFPKLLREAGYQTAVIGKWHLVSEPTGFDYWNILPGQGVYHDPEFIEMGERRKREGYVTDIITDLSMDWMRRRDPARPFMLMCHHKAPHRSWEPDAAHAAEWRVREIPRPSTFYDDYRTRGTAARMAEMRVDTHLNQKADLKLPPPDGVDDRQLQLWKYQRYMQDYLAVVDSLDDNVGRLLDFLDTEGLAENTLVVYTSDQGFFLGEHGWFDKRFMYEEALRMPLLARLPGVIPAGGVNDDIVLNVDFAPTILDVAGAPGCPEMQGRSLAPLVTGVVPTDWRTACYYQYIGYPDVHMVRPHYGVRTHTRKLIHFDGAGLDEWELYDLERDPHELRNVYAEPVYAGDVVALKKELRRLRKELTVPLA